MEKIKLNDGTVLEIQAGCTEYEVSILSTNVDETLANFTDDNLSRFEILNDSDVVCAIYEKKHMKKSSVVLVDEAYLITIALVDVDEMYERISSLEETVDTLVLESLGL